MFAVLDAGIGVAYHLVLTLAALLTPLAGSLAAPVAIVGFTLAVRVLLLPLSYRALRGQAAAARLLPQFRELQQRHAGHPDVLQRELAALREREGAGVFSGCLPLLLQVPFFAIMYRLFRSVTVAGHRNALLGHSLLGAPLGTHWLAGPGPFSTQGLVFAGLFLLLGAVGWAAGRLSRGPAAEQQTAAQAGGGPDGDQAGGAASAAATRFAARIVPFSTVLIAAFVPLAAGLYLLTTSAWTVTERRLLRRRARGVAAARRPGPGDGPAGRDPVDSA